MIIRADQLLNLTLTKTGLDLLLRLSALFDDVYNKRLPMNEDDEQPILSITNETGKEVVLDQLNGVEVNRLSLRIEPRKIFLFQFGSDSTLSSFRLGKNEIVPLTVANERQPSSRLSVIEQLDSKRRQEFSVHVEKRRKHFSSRRNSFFLFSDRRFGQNCEHQSNLETSLRYRSVAESELADRTSLWRTNYKQPSTRRSQFDRRDFQQHDERTRSSDHRFERAIPTTDSRHHRQRPRLRCAHRSRLFLLEFNDLLFAFEVRTNENLSFRSKRNFLLSVNKPMISFRSTGLETKPSKGNFSWKTERISSLWWNFFGEIFLRTNFLFLVVKIHKESNEAYSENTDQLNRKTFKIYVHSAIHLTNFLPLELQFSIDVRKTSLSAFLSVKTEFIASRHGRTEIYIPTKRDLSSYRKPTFEREFFESLNKVNTEQFSRSIEDDEVTRPNRDPREKIQQKRDGRNTNILYAVNTSFYCIRWAVYQFLEIWLCWDNVSVMFRYVFVVIRKQSASFNLSELDENSKESDRWQKTFHSSKSSLSFCSCSLMTMFTLESRSTKLEVEKRNWFCVVVSIALLVEFWIRSDPFSVNFLRFREPKEQSWNRARRFKFQRRTKVRRSFSR